VRSIRAGARLPIGCTLAIAVAVAGCGSGATLNRSQLASKANSICSETNKKLSGAPAPASTSTTNYAPYLAKITDFVQTELGHVKALNPASGLNADYSTYVSNEAKVVEHLKSARAKALKRDSSGMNNELKQTNSPGLALRAAARRLGWTQCLKT
jgi:hypothetical protein